ncbi:MAG: hypothetical protein ACE5RJ_05105 [Nitrosopumilaceae archaeon]
MTTNKDEDPIRVIGYEKYLNCPKCRKEEPYCLEHKADVEVLLSRLNLV